MFAVLMRVVVVEVQGVEVDRDLSRFFSSNLYIVPGLLMPVWIEQISFDVIG